MLDLGLRHLVFMAFVAELGRGDRGHGRMVAGVRIVTLRTVALLDRRMLHLRFAHFILVALVTELAALELQ